MDIPSAMTCRQVALDSTIDPILFFQRARTELLTAVEKGQQWRDECAVTVKRIWESVQDLSSQDASLSARVQEWQQSVRSALPKGEIDNQLRLAQQYLRRLGNFQKRILDAWGLTPYELLQVGTFPPSTLSQTMWRGLAELSGIATLEEARTLLAQKLHERLTAEDHGHGWRGEKWLLPQDIKATKKDIEKKKASHATVKTETPQDFDMPSITENFENENCNAGDSVHIGHVTTRTKRRKRNHGSDRAFDGRSVASRPATRNILDAKGRPNTRNQNTHKHSVNKAQGTLKAVGYPSLSTNLARMKQGPGAGDCLNVVRHHERKHMQSAERDTDNEVVEDSTSSDKVR